MSNALFKHSVIAGILACLSFGRAHSSMDWPRPEVLHGVIKEIVPTQNGFEIATLRVGEVSERGPSLNLEAYFISTST